MPSYRQIADFLTHKIWTNREAGPNALMRYMRKVAQKVLIIVECYLNRSIGTHVSGLTYSTMLATVPVLAIVFAVGRGLGYGAVIEDKVRESLSASPIMADTLLGFVNSYLQHTRNGVFIGFGLLLLLYTAIQLTWSIEIAFNEAWGVKTQRSIYRKITDSVSVFVLLPILTIVGSGLTVFLATTANGYPEYLVLGATLKVIIKLSPYLVSWVLFTALYIYMPNTRVSLRSALWPGLVCGVLFQLLQYFYIHSQMWVSGYNAIYGSFAALPLFLLWVNLSWTLCLIGALWCYANQNVGSYYYIKDIHLMSRRLHDEIMLVVLSEVYKRFNKGMEAHTMAGLCTATGLPAGVVEHIIEELRQMHLLATVSADDERVRYTPAEAGVTVGMVMDRIDRLGSIRHIPLSQSSLWHKVHTMRSTLSLAEPDTPVSDL